MKFVEHDTFKNTFYVEIWHSWLKNLVISEASTKPKYHSDKLNWKLLKFLSVPLNETFPAGSGVVLVSLLLTLNIFHTCSSVSTVNLSRQMPAGLFHWNIIRI